MIKNFLSWVKCINEELDEASWRNQMDYTDPYEKKEVSSPKSGDIVISSPSNFLSKGKAGNSLRDMMQSLYILGSNQDLNTQTYTANAILPRKGARQKTYNAADIMHDVTWRYPEHERQLGQPNRPAVKVWLYIPPDATEAKRKYLLRAEKAAAQNLDFEKQAAAKEDKDKLSYLHVTNVLGGDVNKAMDQTARDERAKYYRQKEAQVKSMVQGRQDPNTLLKHLFADEAPQDLRDPGFQDYLRRIQAPTLADYLAGKDITQQDSYQSPLEKMLMGGGQDNQQPSQSQYQRPAGLASYRQAATNSRNPLAALDTPLPTSRAESVFDEHGDLIQETLQYKYY